MAQEIKFGTDGWRGIHRRRFHLRQRAQVAGAIASYV